jgi:hypothetical protein
VSLDRRIPDRYTQLVSDGAPRINKRTYSALLRRSLAFYAQERLTDERGNPFIIAAHHEEWAQKVQTGRNVAICAARGHGKSFFCTMAYSLWMAERNPNGEGLIFSSSEDQAKKRLEKVIHQVESNPRLAHLLPDKRNRRMWGALGIRLANGFTIRVKGYGSKARGDHPEFIVLDDVMNDNTAFSDDVRKKEIQYFRQAVKPMLKSYSQLLFIGTPMCRGDLLMTLLEDETFESGTYPAVVEEDGVERALWPDMYPLEYLLEEKKSSGALAFSREYLCQPISDSSSLFPSHLFVGDRVEQPYTLGQSLKWWNQKGIRNVFVGVDFGLSSSVNADYTVVFVLGLDGHGNRWILDIRRERGLAYEEQKKLIKDIGITYRPDMIYVEANQAQRIFGEELARQTDLPIHLFHTTKDKHADTGGVPSMRVLLENRKYRIPDADARMECERTNELIDAWIVEMSQMTFNKGRVVSVGEHDDLVHACWIAERAIAGGTFSFSFEEEDGDEDAHLEQMRADFEDSLDQEEFVLGATPKRGRPRMHNARVVQGDEDGRADPGQVLDELENPDDHQRVGPDGSFHKSPSAQELLSFHGSSSSV